MIILDLHRQRFSPWNTCLPLSVLETENIEGKMKTLIIVFLGCAVMLASCTAPGNFPIAASPTSTIPPAAGNPDLTSPPGGNQDPTGNPPASIAITYQRSGGIAGVSETWTFYTDGRLVSAEGKEWQIDPQKIARLVADIEKLGFFELSQRYMPSNTCCDRFTYVLTVQAEDVRHSVTFLEANPDVPQALMDILAAVSSLIRETTGS